jgi:hypothetical protein
VSPASTAAASPTAAAIADGGPSPDAANVGAVRVIYKDADHRWSFAPISLPNSVTTLVIADSNGRQWRNIPTDWQVLAFPGATIDDVDPLLCNINVHSSAISSVVVAVGTNNRCDPSSTLEDRVQDLHSWASDFFVPVYFVGVPTLDRATPAEDQGATIINGVASRVFGSNFIRLPTDFPVEYTSPTDTTHYTRATARRYIDTVKSFLASKN